MDVLNEVEGGEDIVSELDVGVTEVVDRVEITELATGTAALKVAERIARIELTLDIGLLDAIEGAEDIVSELDVGALKVVEGVDEIELALDIGALNEVERVEDIKPVLDIGTLDDVETVEDIGLDGTVPPAEDKGVGELEVKVEDDFEIAVEVVVTAITVLWLTRVANVRAEVTERKNRIVAALGQCALQSFYRSSLGTRG